MLLRRKVVYVWASYACLCVHLKGTMQVKESVQSLFSPYLIGLAFLDLRSRRTDQLLISCFWQLIRCLLLTGQCRMDHVTRHICTHCLGMWEDTQEDRLMKRGDEQVSPVAATEPLLALFTPSTFPCFHLDHWGSPDGQQNSYSGGKGGELQGSCHGDALCTHWAENLGSLSLLPPLHHWKQHSPRAGTW